MNQKENDDKNDDDDVTRVDSPCADPPTRSTASGASVTVTMFGNCFLCGKPIGNSSSSSPEGFSHMECYNAREAQKPLEQVVAELRASLSARSHLLRETSACPFCRWPLPPDDDHYICPCCAFHVSYNNVEHYTWDGQWWFQDAEYGRPPEIVERLRVRAETAEVALTQLRDGLQAELQEWRQFSVEAFYSERREAFDHCAKRLAALLTAADPPSKNAELDTPPRDA